MEDCLYFACGKKKKPFRGNCQSGYKWYNMWYGMMEIWCCIITWLIFRFVSRMSEDFIFRTAGETALVMIVI